MSTRAESSERTVALHTDLAELFKVRIATFVGLSAFVAGVLVPGARALQAAEAGLWIALAACGSSALNQVLERETDARMHRTRNRPIPAGRISARDALLVGAGLAAVAVAMLALRFSLLAALLTLATTCAYVAVYTPLKRVSSLNTVVGALPGAAPPLIGYAALAGHLGGWAWALFAIVLVWQFPHFMAIAWLWRDDYRRGGLRMLPGEPGAEQLVGRTAISHAALLVPIALVPMLTGEAGLVFTFGAIALGIAYTGFAARFAWTPNDQTARALLFASLAHLPLVLALAVLDPVTGALGAFR